MKTITFVLDSFKLYEYYFFGDEIFCESYIDTELAIKNNLPNIWTYDIGHLSFDLNSLGYRIVIVYNENFLHVYEGMSTANGKELRHGHNLHKMLIGGAFDNNLGLHIRNKFYYDNSISTSDLCQHELNHQIIDKCIEIANKMIGFGMSGGIKAMTNEESYEWHKKHSRIDPDTGNMIISDDEIGDGTFEKQYQAK